MNRDEALKRSEEGIAELIASLKQGKSEMLIQYLETMSRFHRYSFGNCILIAIQKPDATLVAGFHRWKDLGRFVKKGEAGIAILAPMISKKKDDDASIGSTDESHSAPKRLYGFRVVYVFDVSQTEGKELPEFGQSTGDPGDRLGRLEEIVRSKNIELVYAENLQGALGLSEGGKISVLKGLTPAESFSVMVHELAHELLHRGDRREQTTKTIRETEAEAVAFVVCRSIGLEPSSKSSDYIQLYNGDAAILMQSLDLIRDVSSAIISELEQSSPKEVEHAA